MQVFSAAFLQKKVPLTCSLWAETPYPCVPLCTSVLHSSHPEVVKMPIPARGCSRGCPFTLGHPCPLYSSRMPMGMPMPTSAPVHTMAMTPPSPSTVAPFLGAHSQVTLPLIHRCHPSHSPSTALFLIPAHKIPDPWLVYCELQGWKDRCRMVGTWQGQGSGTVEMASPSFPLPCTLWGRQPLADSAVLFCITALKSPWRER